MKQQIQQVQKSQKKQQRTLHLHHRSSLVTFFSSVRVRLTLWYLVTISIVLFVIGGSLAALQAKQREDALDNEVETQLYRDAQPLLNTYRQALLEKQPPTAQHLTLSGDEVVLLLHSDGSVLDTRGPLTDGFIQQLRARVGSGQAVFNLTDPPVAQDRTHNWGWWAKSNDYRILVIPVMENDTRLAILMIGLPRQGHGQGAAYWLPHGLLLLLVALAGGYWLAGRALRPVKLITQMANEINASDLRRRLNLKRRDEFGALAATFDQMLARLEAAFKRQTQFTADASHELRTPLTIIGLEIDRALTQLQAPEEYRSVLEQLRAEIEHMSYIVNNLLTLARADTGQIVIQQQEVDLGDLALECVERLLPLARQSQITLSTGHLPELLVLGDSQYLKRAVMNLVENAIKYTAGVGQRVHVELACEQKRWGVIRVRDDGPGIAEEHLPYLFERFYRVDKARTHSAKEATKAGKSQEQPGGTGLGLAIVQWIVQAHGGEVCVESKIGAGSLFEVRLPLLKQQTCPADS